MVCHSLDVRPEGCCREAVDRLQSSSWRRRCVPLMIANGRQWRADSVVCTTNDCERLATSEVVRFAVGRRPAFVRSQDVRTSFEHGTIVQVITIGFALLGYSGRPPSESEKIHPASRTAQYINGSARLKEKHLNMLASTAENRQPNGPTIIWISKNSSGSTTQSGLDTASRRSIINLDAPGVTWHLIFILAWMSSVAFTSTLRVKVCKPSLDKSVTHLAGYGSLFAGMGWCYVLRLAERKLPTGRSVSEGIYFECPTWCRRSAREAASRANVPMQMAGMPAGAEISGPRLNSSVAPIWFTNGLWERIPPDADLPSARIDGRVGV